jgi:hypothetical protein
MTPAESFASFVGIILAAYIASKFRMRENKHSQRVKDLRSKIDVISKEIEDVEDLSLKYFLKPANDEGSHDFGLQIKAKLKRIGAKISSIHADATITAPTGRPSLSTGLMHFRRAVTLEGFDSGNRVALVASDPKFDMISAAASRLKETLELIYAANQ